MKALILAAGYATRLYPLTKDRPKPLLSIAGKPILEYIMEKLERAEEIDALYLVTNQKFILNFQNWLDNFETKKKIKILNDGSTCDDDRLGAIGDIRFFLEEEKIDDDLLIVAGDNLFQFDLSRFIKSFEKRKAPCIALYNIGDRKRARNYGVVTVDENQRIVKFEEKPPRPTSTLIATCLYLFPKEDLNLISTYLKEKRSSDAPGYYIQWLAKRGEVYGFVFKEKWYDIGSLESLKEADLEYRKKSTTENTESQKTLK
ncbi:UTP--glucose-1-phosphate uridylyltransferase [subsurface metagenome]